MRARFVLTRGNNFLGLIANYVTHCVSLNMILSKHSCFGLKQIGIMGSARSRVGIENFNGKQDRYIFIERILEALETFSRHDVCCSFQELWLLKLSNVCTHERTRNYTSPLSLAFFHFSLLSNFSRSNLSQTKYRAYPLVDSSISIEISCIQGVL